MKNADLEIKLPPMDSLIARKKEEKRKRLLDAAYALFTESTISDTSIAQICAKAGIAKGTFYLYFTDKEDIARALARRISYQVLKKTYHTVADNAGNFVENAVQMADELIEFFEEDKEVLKVMKKDFIWPIGEDEFLTSNDPIMSSIRQDIDTFSQKSGISSHQILVRIYALICMIASVCYSSIFDQFPADIITVKPEISSMIRASFQPVKKPE